MTNYFFTPEMVRASLILALICVSIGIGLFACFRYITARKHYGAWMVSWLFFAIFLAACLGFEEWPWMNLLAAVQLASAGICALFMLAGSFELFEVSPYQSLLGPGVVLIAVWSMAAVTFAPDWLVVKVPIFALLGGAGVYTGYFYFQNRLYSNRFNMAALGFALWGVQMAVFPFLGATPTIRTFAYFTLALLALLIASGMIVDHAVEMSERKFRAVFDSAGDAIFIVDMMTLKILEVNRSAQSLTKRRSFELVGRPFGELCPDLRKEGNGEVDNQKLFTTVFKPYNEFQIARGKGAGTVACEGDMGLVGWQKRSAIQLNVREAGDRKKFGQQLRRAEKLSSLGQLIAGVAHELNNPLAVVLGFAQLLAKRHNSDEKTRSDVDKMLHECERAAKIVRNLLTFVRPSEPQMSVVNFNQLIARFLEVREAEFSGSDIQVLKRLAPELPNTKADMMQIEQVLTNLISNAVHAMSKNSRPPVLILSTEVRGTYIRIIVADNGPGMTPETVSKVFDPFFTTKGPGKGTGLGLTICHGIVKEHLGKIWVESDVGVGTRFFIELPIVPCDEEPAPLQSAVKATVADAHAAQRRLLIVDDEPGIREVLKDILSCNGYSVETADNGAEAMERISSVDYDLIISDLCMPEMDGPALYENVRHRDAHLASRIVFVTGDTVNTKSRAFLESTGNRWLSKPFNMSDVEETIATILRQQPVLASQN